MIARVEREANWWVAVLRGLLLALFIYLFLLSVNMMGTAFKLVLTKDLAGRMLAYAAANPLLALMAGVLCTAIVQSSSFVTSVVVGLVAGGILDVPSAVPIVMGANIGTTVTNTLVSLGHISRRDDFRRACGGAIVHDLFNVFSVLVLFPLEMATRFLTRTAVWLGDQLFGQQTIELPNPLAWLVKPVSNAVVRLLTTTFGASKGLTTGIMCGLGLVMLFVALFAIVKLLRAVMVKRIEGFFGQVLFRNAGTALMVGLIVTVLVQSSSVTTSLVVPLVGAGVLVVEQIYPYTLGANVGTTATAVLAALATGSKAALVCAIAHLLFNVFGIAIWYPLRIVPISVAKALAAHFAEKRYRAPLHVAIVFFGIPGLVILIPRLWRWLGL